MRTDSRLSRMLHVLLHLARAEAPMRSEEIAGMLDTNAVVVRRTMAGLREAGYVRSSSGPNGGWTLATDLETLSVLDVHVALGGSERLFSIGVEQEAPSCIIEAAVNDALIGAMADAEALLLSRLGDINLARLADRFSEAWESWPGRHSRA